MKIAFIGTHGVGKTTLCYHLAGILKKKRGSVDIVKEVARACPLPINRQTTLAAQSWILHTQIAMEIVSQDQNDNVICDRSVLDNYAYLVHAEGAQPVLEQLVTYWMETYDYLFKVPVGLVLQTDGVRDVDAEFQLAIDRLVDRMLQERGLRYYNLSGSNREIWIAFVMSVVERERRAAPSTSRQMSLPIPGDPS
ncbi:MAG: ATP/GTP-binding protein [Vicinamibacteria bacterium]